MASPAPAIDAELEAVTAALAAVEPRTKRLLLFGSRARGDARPDSDFDLLVVMPQATLTPQERQQAHPHCQESCPLGLIHPPGGLTDDHEKDLRPRCAGASPRANEPTKPGERG